MAAVERRTRPPPESLTTMSHHNETDNGLLELTGGEDDTQASDGGRAVDGSYKRGAQIVRTSIGIRDEGATGHSPRIP
jgi:hypothetical protein